MQHHRIQTANLQLITQVHRIQRALPQMPIVRPTGTIHLSPAGQIQIPDTTILLDQWYLRPGLDMSILEWHA